MDILDATIREGQQRANKSYTIEQKVMIAQKLDELGVDFIQVGFPITNDGSREVCESISTDAKLQAMARATKKDIDAAVEANVDVIGVSVPTSELQRGRVIGLNEEETKDMARKHVEYAKSHGMEVHFGAMDGFRTNPEYINELFTEIDAEYYSIADTVGELTPSKVKNYLSDIDHDLSSVSVHFHNDLGLATANALTAAECGVGKIDVTIAGVGERAGNVPLEELIVSIDKSNSGILYNIDSEKLISICNNINDIASESIDDQKPILGDIVYKHESGMHTAAMLDEPSTFEPFNPEKYGGKRSLLFGPSSGKGSARRIIELIGGEVTEENINSVVSTFESFDKNIPKEDAIELAKESIDLVDTEDHTN